MFVTLAALPKLPAEAPRRPLDRFVARVEVFRPQPGELRRTVDMLPDGSTSLLFRALGGGEGTLSVRGPLTRAYYKTAPSLPLGVRIVFQPGGAYPFFGRPVADLTDRLVPLEDVWGAGARTLLDELLATAEGGGDAVAVMERTLVERLRADAFEPACAFQARAGVRMLAGGARSIDDVASALGLSSRHLRRTFQATVGLGPKTYARIARFQRALALGRAAPGRWSEVAHAAGYFDQAHLSADFRELARSSPGAVGDGVPRVRHEC
jgi:AraC-like DNA-binding protein